MFHWFSIIQNTRGDVLPGWQIECVELADGQTVVPIFADENSTPIATVSGITNRAVADENGNYGFFVPSGNYSLRFYNSAGDFQRLQRYIPMYGADAANTENLASNDAGKGAALVGVEGSGTVQDALEALASADADRPTTAALAAPTGSSLSGFQQSGAGAVARTAEAKLRETVSVKDFGASPSASASTNVTAFNNALRYLHDIGGGTLLVHAGVYELNDRLEMGANTTIKCDTGVRLVRKHNSGFLRNSLDITSANTGFSGNSNIVIDGGIWDGNGTEFYNAFNHLEIGHCENIIIRNVTFLDCIRAHAVDLSAARNVLIENNKFLGFAHLRTSPDGYGTSGDGLSEGRTFSEAVQLDHNVPGSFGYGAIDRTQCERVFFKGNVVGPNPARSDSTFGSYGAGIGSHGSVNDRFMRDIVIQGNTFDGCLLACVRIWKWDDVTITGNTFKNSLNGVRVTPTSHFNISANNADGTPSGQGQAARRYAITGNTFDGMSGAAIVFTSPSFDLVTPEPIFFHKDVSITGNVFSNISASGLSTTIDLQFVQNASVSGNSFRNVRRPISVRFSKQVSISGNTAQDVQREFAGVFEDSAGGTDPSLFGQGLTSDINITGNNASDVGFAGIAILCAAERVAVTGNRLSNVSTFEPTRSGITVTDGADDVFISGNSILDAGAANKPVGGVFIDGSVTNATVTNNKFFNDYLPGQIIERGSNANGEFIRFADGTQICWGDRNVPGTANSPELYSYPATFSALPSFTSAPANGQFTGAGTTNRLRIHACGAWTGQTTTQYRGNMLSLVANPDSARGYTDTSLQADLDAEAAASRTVAVSWVAIGRWF